MADEHALLRAIEKADRFRTWMETEEVSEYFDTVREQIIEAMLATKDSDDEARYRCKVAVSVLDKFRQFLTTGMQDGEIAKRDLQELKSGRRPFF